MNNSLKRYAGRRPVVAGALALWLAAGLACATSGGSPSVSERATSLALTGAAVLTGTAGAATLPATRTTIPSATLAATATAPPATETATQAPTSTAAPTACPKDDSDFVADVTIPDGTHFAPGAAFNKTWRLRNSGPCTWTSGYQLRFIGGEPMSGASVNLSGIVTPGATVDITVALVAPAGAGTHRSNWRLYSPDGSAFGTEPYVEIKVP
jgi:Ig-like domain-containing protein